LARCGVRRVEPVRGAAGCEEAGLRGREAVRGEAVRGEAAGRRGREGRRRGEARP
jgi:hypothetical protein